MPNPRLILNNQMKYNAKLIKLKKKKRNLSRTLKQNMKKLLIKRFNLNKKYTSSKNHYLLATAN